MYGLAFHIKKSGIFLVFKTSASGELRADGIKTLFLRKSLTIESSMALECGVTVEWG